ncbi:MAG TPA: Type 1 glutamine amidotransferase-like domain-containing protein [Thermoplasmataceae archaeon]|nr:Type 1 glutamine amidotransferase-like domain-containing protein [Thermoplasmataceae archaeon]
MFKGVRKLSSSGKILIIPWTSDSHEKEVEYSKVLHDYFSHCGFEEVLFLDKTDPENEIQRKFSEVDTIYLPGGDTEVLYRELKQRTLQDRLFEFPGVIIGNSAGAMGNSTQVSVSLISTFPFITSSMLATLQKRKML